MQQKLTKNKLLESSQGWKQLSCSEATYFPLIRKDCNERTWHFHSVIKTQKGFN